MLKKKAKKKLTRKQAAKRQLTAVQKLHQLTQNQAAVYTAVLAVYRRAVEMYFGSDLPPALSTKLELGINTAIEKGAKENTEINLSPVVEKIVSEYMLEEAAEQEALAQKDALEGLPPSLSPEAFKKFMTSVEAEDE